MAALRKVDLSKPSFEAARQLAIRVAAEKGEAEGLKEFIKLLWLVPFENGGFCHGGNAAVKDRAKRMGFTFEQVAAGAAVPASWPVADALKVAA